MLELSVPPTQRLTLSDGRTLAYIECGDSNGSPIFYFHGHPGSRLEVLLVAESAQLAGVRLIGIDRPGMGFSDFKPGRRLVDWPEDVVQLANALNIDQFAVEGVSGGGPYALACAYRLPERLKACGVIASLGPIDLVSLKGMMRSNVVQFIIARYFPWLLQPLWWLYLGRHAKLIDNAQELTEFSSQLLKMLPKTPHSLKQDPKLVMFYLREMLEAFRTGSDGVVHDSKLFVQPWGFNLEEIACENVHLWHGEEDVHVPVSMGRAMAQAIPNCRATFFPGDDHLTLAFDHREKFMRIISSVGKGKPSSE